MKKRIEELEERIGRLEEHLFGMTFPEAEKYLQNISEATESFTSDFELDRYLQQNLDMIHKAEKCVGA